jgi:hypothetical protein
LTFSCEISLTLGYLLSYKSNIELCLFDNWTKYQHLKEMYLLIVDITLKIWRCFKGTNSTYFIQSLSMLKTGYYDDIILWLELYPQNNSLRWLLFQCIFHVDPHVTILWQMTLKQSLFNPFVPSGMCLCYSGTWTTSVLQYKTIKHCIVIIDPKLSLWGN